MKCQENRITEMNLRHDTQKEEILQYQKQYTAITMKLQSLEDIGQIVLSHAEDNPAPFELIFDVLIKTFKELKQNSFELQSKISDLSHSQEVLAAKFNKLETHYDHTIKNLEIANLQNKEQSLKLADINSKLENEKIHSEEIQKKLDKIIKGALALFGETHVIQAINTESEPSRDMQVK